MHAEKGEPGVGTLAIMDGVNRSALALAAGILLLSCSMSHFAAAENLPGDWHTGIATNYGGAQDGMVSDRFGTPLCFAHAIQMSARAVGEAL